MLFLNMVGSDDYSCSRADYTATQEHVGGQ